MPPRSSTAPPSATSGMKYVPGLRRKHADQLAAAQPLQIQIEDDETGHRLHQHLSGLQAGGDSGHREARLLQHATKLTPAPGIGVRQQNHYMTT